MCKVMIMAGVKPERRKDAIRFTKKMADIMSPGNDDGLGYAAVDVEGNLFAERWLNNKDAFKFTGGNPNDMKISNMLRKAIKNSTVETVYTKHGEPDLNKMVAITLHTRFATSSKGMKNTHPFIDEDTSLIHNGVISNIHEFNFKLSSCDSEAILISYLKNQTGVLPENIKSTASSLTGYYACGIFARESSGARILDVFKGHNDNLYAMHVDELDTWVMSSNEENIRKACSDLGFRHGAAFQLLDGHLMRFDPVTGILILDQEFDLLPRWGRTDSYNHSQWHNRYQGSHVYNSETSATQNVTQLPGVKKGLTDEDIEFYKKTPAIKELSATEKWEYLTDSGYWNQMMEG